MHNENVTILTVVIFCREPILNGMFLFLNSDISVTTLDIKKR